MKIQLTNPIESLRESYVEYSFQMMDYKVTRFSYRLMREENPEKRNEDE